MNAARILIVDDHPVNRAVLEELLRDEYETATAESGEEAKSRAPEFRPDLVLLDVMMPGISGFEVCRWMRTHARLAATKIIIVSAKSTCADKKEGIAAGADEYITKPFDVRALKESVRAHLTKLPSVNQHG